MKKERKYERINKTNEWIVVVVYLFVCLIDWVYFLYIVLFYSYYCFATIITITTTSRRLLFI